MTDLYIIRHGEGDYQVRKIVPGPKGDKGLSDLGRQQARRLRDRLAATGEIKADVLIASTLPRAHETAEIIAPALGLPVLLDDDLQESRPGEADGLTFAEADEKYGKYIDFRQDPFFIHSPGNENFAQFNLRVALTLNRITRQYEGKSIVLVAHGGIVDGSMLYFFRFSGAFPPPIILFTHNTSITHWNKGWDVRDPELWRLMKYNDDLHLRGIDTDRFIDWTSLSGPAITGQDQTAVPLPNEAAGQ